MSNQDTIKPLVSWQICELSENSLPEDNPNRELDILLESELQSEETSNKKLIEWLRHLSEKDWFTASHARQLIAIAIRICPDV